jgi:hypothetical protein
MHRYWRIQLKDDHGTFWLMLDQMWTDNISESMRYDDEVSANRDAREVKTRIADNPEWFPKIKIITFKESKQ